MRRHAGRLLLCLCLATLTLPVGAAEVLVQGLQDLDLGTWRGAGDLAGDSSHCVYALPGGRFSVTASGGGAGGAFVLRNGIAELAYQVSYDDGAGATGLISGQWLGGLRGNPNPVQQRRCLNGQRTPQTLLIRIPTAGLAAAPAGLYRGTLTLLVAPD